MFVDNGLHGSQAKTLASVLRTALVKGVKDEGLFFRGNARAVVVEFNNDFFRGLPGGDMDMTLARAKVYGIVEKIFKGALELQTVGL